MPKLIATKFNKNFSLLVFIIFFTGVLLGIKFEDPTNIFTIVLITVMFNSFSKIEIREALGDVFKQKIILFHIVLFSLIIPSIFGTIYFFYPNDYILGAFLSTAVPAGILAPTIVDIFKGNVTLSVLLVSITHIIAPITIPLLVSIFVSNGIKVDTYGIFLTLLKFVVVPLILGQIFRRFFQNFRTQNDIYFTSLNITGILIITFIVSSNAKDLFIANFIPALIIFLSSFVLFAILFALPYFLSFQKNKKDQATIAVTKMYMNIVIGIIIAQQFFNEKVLLVTLIVQIVYFITLPITKYIINKTGEK